MIFIGFTPVIARIVEWLVPDRKLGDEKQLDRRYLDDILVHTPGLALDVVRMELARIGAASLRMVRGALDPVIDGSAEELTELADMDDEVDRLHSAIVTYLGRLSTENLTEAQSHRVSAYLSATNYFENIGDMIETNLVDAGRTRLDNGVQVSPATRDILRDLHEKVLWAVQLASEAVSSDDDVAAREVVDAKKEVNRLSAEAESHLTKRLSADAPQRLAAFRVETELVESLKRVYYFAKRIARLVIESSRLYERENPLEPLDDDSQEHGENHDREQLTS